MTRRNITAAIGIWSDGGGGIVSIWLSHGGGLSHAGQILCASYTTPERVGKLIDLGDLYHIGPHLGRKHSPKAIDSNHPWCSSFLRDFSTPPADPLPRFYTDETEFVSHGALFNYLLKDGQWTVACIGNNNVFTDVRRQTLIERLTE